MVKTYHPGSSAPPPRLSHSSSSSSYQTQHQQPPPSSQPYQPQPASHPTHAGKGPISVPPPANLPTSGRHRVVLDRTLIELLVGGGGAGEKRAYDGDGQEGREFVGLKYKFKPSSIPSSAPGTYTPSSSLTSSLDPKEVQIHLQASQPSQGGLSEIHGFSGKIDPSTGGGLRKGWKEGEKEGAGGKDVVLVWNEDRRTFNLVPLAKTYNVNHDKSLQRSSLPILSANNRTHVAPTNGFPDHRHSPAYSSASSSRSNSPAFHASATSSQASHSRQASSTHIDLSSSTTLSSNHHYQQQQQQHPPQPPPGVAAKRPMSYPPPPPADDISHSRASSTASSTNSTNSIASSATPTAHSRDPSYPTPYVQSTLSGKRPAGVPPPLAPVQPATNGHTYPPSPPRPSQGGKGPVRPPAPLPPAATVPRTPQQMLALPTGGPPSHIVPSPHHSSDGGSDDDDDDDDDDDFAAQLRRDLEAANSGANDDDDEEEEDEDETDTSMAVDTASPPSAPAAAVPPPALALTPALPRPQPSSQKGMPQSLNQIYGGNNDDEYSDESASEDED